MSVHCVIGCERQIARPSERLRRGVNAQLRLVGSVEADQDEVRTAIGVVFSWGVRPQGKGLHLFVTEKLARLGLIPFAREVDVVGDAESEAPAGPLRRIMAR